MQKDVENNLVCFSVKFFKASNICIFGMNALNLRHSTRYLKSYFETVLLALSVSLVHPFIVSVILPPPKKKKDMLLDFLFYLFFGVSMILKGVEETVLRNKKYTSLMSAMMANLICHMPLKEYVKLITCRLARKRNRSCPLRKK